MPCYAPISQYENVNFRTVLRHLSFSRLDNIFPARTQSALVERLLGDGNYGWLHLGAFSACGHAGISASAAEGSARCLNVSADAADHYLSFCVFVFERRPVGVYFFLLRAGNISGQLF